MSKKIPGMTIVCSFNNSSKKVLSANLNRVNVSKRDEKTHEAIIYRMRETLQADPNIEGASGWYVYVQADLFQSMKDMVTLHLKMLL